EGACVVNSVSLEPAAELGELAARSGSSLVLMHCRGAMTDMAGFSQYPEDGYEDVVREVANEWSAAAKAAMAAGLAKEDLVLAPGLGFAKSPRPSIELCARLDELVALGHPVLVGASRKSFLARTDASTTVASPLDRLGGSIAAALACAARGASILRV